MRRIQDSVVGEFKFYFLKIAGETLREIEVSLFFEEKSKKLCPNIGFFVLIMLSFNSHEALLRLHSAMTTRKGKKYEKAFCARNDHARYRFINYLGSLW